MQKRNRQIFRKSDKFRLRKTATTTTTSGEQTIDKHDRTEKKKSKAGLLHDTMSIDLFAGELPFVDNGLPPVDTETWLGFCQAAFRRVGDDDGMYGLIEPNTLSSIQIPHLNPLVHIHCRTDKD